MAPDKLDNAMRKGTKSCAECRKRKVKCIYGDDTETCMNCIARRDKCFMQTKASNPVKKTPADTKRQKSNKSTLEKRIAQLENLVTPQHSISDSQSLNQSLAVRQGSQLTLGLLENPHQDHIVSKSLGTGNQDPVNVHRDIAPSLNTVGSLFNNTIWKQDGPELKNKRSPPTSTRGTIINTPDPEDSAKDRQVCQELCQDIPQHSLIASIVGATGSWWKTWRPIGTWFQQLMAQNNVSTLLEAINWCFSSGNPPLAALGILCIATCLQQLDSQSHKDIISQLHRPPGELFQAYLNRVTLYIINDNFYSSSYAGIEVILMTGKIYMNLGLLKMNWVLTHRAIIHAQLLHFHRPHQTSPDEIASHMSMRHESWFFICERDLYASLLLGLPYAANWKTISPTARGLPGTLGYFQYEMMRLSSRIIDRNQMGLETSILDTQDITHDMVSVANTLPSELWDPPNALLVGRVDRAGYMELLAVEFWYFQAKVLLHQPLMIQSLEDHKLLEHRESCLSACRDTLRIYYLMRSDSMSVFNMVKLVDYQAFICSAILLLGLLGYGSVQPLLFPPTIKQAPDWETVQSTLDILRKASRITNNSIALQAVQGLETLSLLVENGRAGACPTQTGLTTAHSVRITVPGSGVITLSPGALMTKPISTSSEPTNVHPASIFHLSSYTSPNPMIPIAPTPSSQQVPEVNSLLSADLGGDISMMDLDWSNLISNNLDDDWAWLADANAANLL